MTEAHGDAGQGAHRPNRVERKKEEVRSRIVDVAMELFRRQGFAATTVEQIAEQVDVARGTVFNHFPAKEEIIAEYVTRAVRSVLPHATALYPTLPDTRSRVQTALQLSLEWIEANLPPDLRARYLAYGVGQTIQGRLDDPRLGTIYRFILELGQDAGEVRRDISAAELAEHLEWAHVSAVLVRLTQPERFTAAQVAERIADMFLRGVQA